MFNKGNKGGSSKQKGFGFEGFSIGSRPPSKPGSSMPARSLGYALTIGKRRIHDEEDYFDDEDEAANTNNIDYQPAPGSPGRHTADDEDSDDPLDAFMLGINQELKGPKDDPELDKKKQDKGVREDLEVEDDEESYYRYMEENPNAGLLLDEEDDLEYDSDGNVLPPDNYKKAIDPLPPIDHSEMYYMPFEKNFYQEHEEIAKMTKEEADKLMKQLGIRVSGYGPPNPVCSFAHFGFDEQLMNCIRKSEYTKPMPIQALGIPTALSGRDVIGIAKTGSGKTAAYLWPMLVHIMDQRELAPEEGPVGLILAPTRELAQQIYQEGRKFGKAYNINVMCAYGGGSMWEQTKACQDGAEIIVATPGRLIDLIKKKATNLQRVSMLVLDEADKMFAMGFEPQVKSICSHVRPDRQTLLFSATFRKKVEKLARHALTDPIRIVQGEVGEANEDVIQMVDILPSVGPAKWTWLIKRLVEFTTLGKVLIFVTRKLNCQELATNLRARDFDVGLLHGDMSQVERNEVITNFKKKDTPILVATDVAARGLDIPSIRTVVNYDVARDIDTHTHRIGRTGRAGEKGYAYTLVTDKDKEFAGHLVRNLEGANQYVPKPLLDIANQNMWFKSSRYKQGRGKKLNISGKGLGFKERPGLGAEGSSRLQESSSIQSYKTTGTLPVGQQTDRLGALKQAFTSQFKSNFIAQEIEAPRETGFVQMPVSSPESEKAKRSIKKSRWN